MVNFGQHRIRLTNKRKKRINKRKKTPNLKEQKKNLSALKKHKNNNKMKLKIRQTSHLQKTHLIGNVP